MQDLAKEIWQEYLKGQEYNRSINIYETVKNNQNFVLGKQWEGLSVKSLDPLTFNVLRRVVNLFVSVVVSDDVSAHIEPLIKTDVNMQGCKVIDILLKNVIEQSKVKAKNRYAIRDACINGDSAFYIYFDKNAQDIMVDIIDNTNIYFGNTSLDDVQRQPYIIICMRRDVEEVQNEFIANGGDKNVKILSDDELDLSDSNLKTNDNKVTVLLKMYKKDGKINFIKTTQKHILMPEKAMPYKLYPISYISWEKKKNCYHGISPVTEAIGNQIAINKLYSMYMHCVKQQAFPKIIYDMTRFPNGYSSEIGKAIGIRGNPNDSVLSAFKPPEISGQVLGLLNQMISHTMELMGASDATLGNVRPDNSAAIIAVQRATTAPLELVRMEFFRFVEDYIRVFVDMMRIHYGTKTVYEDDAQTRISFDFGNLDDLSASLNVEVGASSYWSETMQTITNDNLMRSGIISDPVLYVENIPSNLIRGKNKILQSLKETQKNIKEEQTIESANI